MNYRVAMKALAAIPAAALALGLMAAPAQAVSVGTGGEPTGISAHFYGHCRNWAMVYTTTHEATHVLVYTFGVYGTWPNPLTILASKQAAPDTTGGVAGAFHRDGKAKVVQVEIAGGAEAGGVTRTHTFLCGSGR